MIREGLDSGRIAPSHPRRERGVVLIMAYKFAKGGLWLVFAVLLVAFMGSGIHDRMLEAAEYLRQHTGAWSIEIAQLVTRAATPRGLWTVTIALAADGALSLVEGWALFHGKWWGPWLVVVASGSFLPLEVIAFVRHRRAGRAAVFLINAAIVAYLARKALRERSMGARKSS